MRLIGGGTFVEWKSRPNSSLWIQGERAHLSFVCSQMLIASDYYSGFGQERDVVCYYHLSASPLRNLFSQLALQLSII